MPQLALHAEIVLTDPTDPEVPFCTKEVTDLHFVPEMDCIHYVSHDRVEYVPMRRVYLLVLL